MNTLGKALGLVGILIGVYLVLVLGTNGVGSGASPIVNSFGNFSRRIVVALQGR
jgi:hypothetical protein